MTEKDENIQLGEFHSRSLAYRGAVRVGLSRHFRPHGEPTLIVGIIIAVLASWRALGKEEHKDDGDEFGGGPTWGSGLSLRPSCCATLAMLAPCGMALSLES